jgi:hypothetical protein
MQLTFIGVAIVLGAVIFVGMSWLGRARGARRLRLAANIYAEREIAQEARWRAAQRSR